jgi:transcriptional regulator with XRE-family HTH domain
MISKLLRDARTRSGLTQAELASRSGTSQAALSAYERGRKDPAASTASRILAAAGHRLVAEPAGRPVVTPSPAELAERGRILAQVIDLAERLPGRTARELRYPPLGRSEPAE